MRHDRPMNDKRPCPCGNLQAYEHCCGRWHGGPERLRAPDAERLVRSRYSAYVLDLRDYLLDSWHPHTRPATLEPNAPGLRWLGLQVREHIVIDERRATVEFVARYQLQGRATRLHELSRFERQEDAIWLYVDGIAPAERGRRN